jgi:hypothetical protein
MNKNEYVDSTCIDGSIKSFLLFSDDDQSHEDII